MFVFDLTLCPRCKHHTCRLSNFGTMTPGGMVWCFRYCYNDGCDFEVWSSQKKADVAKWQQNEREQQEIITLELEWLEQLEDDLVLADFGIPD